MENINEVYDQVLNSAILSKEDVAKMSEEDVKELLDSADNIINNNSNLKVISELPSNNGVSINNDKTEGEDIMVDVRVNPVTGEKYMMDEKNKPLSDIEENFVTETFEEMLNNPNYKSSDIDDIIIPDNIIKDSASTQFEFLKDNEVEMVKFINLIKSFQAGDTKNLFNRLPEGFQKEINKTYFSMGSESNMDIKSFRKLFATHMIESFIMESTVETMQLDLQEQLNKIVDDAGAEVKEFYADEMSRRLDKLLSIYNDIKDTDTEKAETVLAISEAIKESYELNKFKEVLSTRYFRIKPFELEKPEKIYRDFNNKYINSIYNIYNVNLLPGILRKYISEDIEDIQILKFVIIFCKYTQNMTPNNITEHSFMYYFIMNIVSLSIINHEHTEFSDTVINNISDCIRLIKN